jgi:N-glycosylase/DNA lyase
MITKPRNVTGGGETLRKDFAERKPVIMEYTEHGGMIEIQGVSDFDPIKIFECGQCFRWNADENGVYTGVAYGHATGVRADGDSVFISGTAVDFETVWRDYFDLDRDYASIRKHVCIDDFMIAASEYGAGIRILRQDKWEALCSFIISQCNNIPRIKKIIEKLCLLFGDRLWLGNQELRAFPSAERIAALDAADLAPIRCGYRAEYIIGAARKIAGGMLDLDALAAASTDEARSSLKELRGVGDKVADCVLLFGLNKTDSFPLDVWMKRAVERYYGSGFDPGVFSPYEGIAQQYIYHYIRNS